AFEKNAVDFLLKPITYERFLKAVSKVKDKLVRSSTAKGSQEEKDYFFVKSEVKGKMVRVDTDEIDYIEALQNYVKIHTSEGILTTYLTMNEVEECLCVSKLSRVYKSYDVINVNVNVLTDNQILLDN